MHRAAMLTADAIINAHDLSANPPSASVAAAGGSIGFVYVSDTVPPLAAGDTAIFNTGEVAPIFARPWALRCFAPLASRCGQGRPLVECGGPPVEVSGRAITESWCIPSLKA